MSGKPPTSRGRRRYTPARSHSQGRPAGQPRQNSPVGNRTKTAPAASWVWPTRAATRTLISATDLRGSTKSRRRSPQPPSPRAPTQTSPVPRRRSSRTGTSSCKRSFEKYAAPGKNSRAWGPVYAEFEELIRAAYDKTHLHQAVGFAKVRRRVLNEMLPPFNRFHDALQSDVRAGDAAWAKLVSLVHGNQAARALVAKVNQQYPDGFLARGFKKP